MMTRDERNARRRARYAESPDKVREQNALWRVKNPKRAKECDKKSYEKRKDAIAAYKREYYKANTEQEKARAAEWYEENSGRAHSRRMGNRKRVQEVKEQRGCRVCGEKDSVVLDFHHTDPKEKSFTIAPSSSRSWKKLEEEMAKCDVLCRNCHARFHSLDGNKPHQIARGLPAAESSLGDHDDPGEYTL